MGPGRQLTCCEGFDYDFNAIQDETNELFAAYKDMFEVAISQGGIWRTIMLVYTPFLNRLFVSHDSYHVKSTHVYAFQPDHTTRLVQRCQAVIHRVAGRLVQEGKRKIDEGENSGKDLLSLLRGFQL